MQISTNLSVSTIFKTIPSDVNKSGKALEILGKKASDLKIAFDNAGGGIKGFRSALAELTKKDFKLNDAGEIITKDNINSFIPKISNKQANDLAERIAEFDKDSNSLDNFYKTLSNGEERYIKDFIKNTEDLSKVTGEDLTKACNNARQSILDHNEALQKTSLSSRAASFGMEAFKGVITTAAFTAISVAVSAMAEAIITKITEIVNAYENGINKIKDPLHKLLHRNKGLSITTIPYLCVKAHYY